MIPKPTEEELEVRPGVKKPREVEKVVLIGLPPTICFRTKS